MVEKRVKNEEILWLVNTIIFHDCARDIAPKIQSPPSLFDRLPSEKSLFKVARGKGLPIGNLTSQFFANVYLNELDQFVKHILKAKYYVRYVDDMIILGESKNQLKDYKQRINIFLQEKLKLILHPLKQKISPVSNGIDFVGYIVRADYTLIRKRVVDQWRQKLTNCPRDKFAAVNNSYLAHAKWANGWGLKKAMLASFEQ